MSANETRGPLTLGRSRDGSKVIVSDSRTRTVAQFYRPERDTDAVLFIHAPALAEALAQLVKAVDNLDSEEAGAGRNLFISPGCVVCTDGVTPDAYNTGLCAYHAARLALAKARGK